MLLTIIIVIAALIALMALHEFGHFITAKKLGMKIEEFGIGYPPRLFAKKFKETIYSLNLLPFGAFVKIEGEEKEVKGKTSFSSRPLWQRVIVILGGVVSFWLIAWVIFSFTAGVWGLPYAVEDDDKGAPTPYVQVLQVLAGSPAESAGIKAGDTIEKIKNQRAKIKNIETVKEVQEFVAAHSGEEITIFLKRGDEILEKNLTPVSFKEGGKPAIGIALSRIAKIKTSWYYAPLVGAKLTVYKTIQIPAVLAGVLAKTLKGEKVEGVELSGPIGIGVILGSALQAGIDNFLMFIALIAIWLALFNLAPIPALDGGKILFLAIEAVRKKPVRQEIEQKITAFFFFFLLLIMAFVTVKDIIKLL